VKFNVLVYKALNGLSLQSAHYLHRPPTTSIVQRRYMWDFKNSQSLDDRALAVAGPSLWNSLYLFT